MRDFKFFNDSRKPTTNKPEIVDIDIPEESHKNESDLPEGMPLTNRLDKMTTEQAKWAIRNGTAWIAYLKEQQASGADVKLVEHKAGFPVEVSAAEKHKAICDILEKVWLDLTDNASRSYLQKEQIPDWVKLLEWAVKAIPLGFEIYRNSIQEQLKGYQKELKGEKN